jgi:hypothetical protein
MSNLRLIGIPSLALALAIGVSACQKKTAETETSMTDTTSMSAESPYPVEETPPPASNTPPPSTPSTSGGGSSTHSSTHSGSSSSGTSTASRGTKIPVGTDIDLVMVTTANTKTANIGDPIEAKLADDLIIDGKVVAARDATVRGTISDVKRASHSKSGDERASLKFNFTTIETTGGEKSLNATVTGSEGKQLEAKSTSTRDKLIIGGSTVAGAVIGKVAGKSTKSTIIGAVGGAVVGTGVVMSAKGYELEVPAGAKVTIRTDDPITVVVR